MWFKKAYCRNVVDMHIHDWDKSLLSRFDPFEYVRLLKRAGVESTVLYAHSHVGLTYYPTRIGRAHRNLNGRNIFAETSSACRKEGIAVQLYFSLIFDTWAYRNHPNWRIRNADGSGVSDKSRYGVCCPNSPYRDYVAEMIHEFCESLEFDGVRFDMTFWPTVCYCQYCRERFREEVGAELPLVINWDDPVWVAFARKREDWLNEFAELATRSVLTLRPDASVEHQASTMTLFWRFGVTHRLARNCTFLQGDFYGDIVQGSVARKLFYNLTEHRPAGFETSFCVSLNNHTARKSSDWMRCKAAAAIADACAFVFIDAINVDGSLNPAVYETMGPIYEEFRKYKPFLGGERCQDVVIYLSTESKFDPKDNGKSLAGVGGPQGNQEPSSAMPHVDAMFAAAATMMKEHIPFGIVTKRNLAELSRFKTLILPNVLMMDDEEVMAIQEYVRNGGTVYASKYTSLQHSNGTRPGDFMLSKILGIKYLGETSESFTYIAPDENYQHLFEEYHREYPLGLEESQVSISVFPDSEVWATTTLPFSHPDDWENFASIHSNPPGQPTNAPAIVFHRYGSGKTIYVTAALEKYPTFRKIFANIIRHLCPTPSFEVSAPPVIEVTAFWQGEYKRHIVSLLNFQAEQPNVPVRDVKVTLRTEGKKVKRVSLLPEGLPISFTSDSHAVTFFSPEIAVLRMFSIEYE